ncbi:nitroreductase family protein [Halalkalibacter okhensis]|uniref:NAD(P)H nitroreductase n=1 Tax=Halalkalibacter okhensis TaxID=333138 RepID=A0A0B0ILB6_9BACI|nr:nitroreductase family protein [Halalkalibacter okhensis]KHF40446.1 NAD(P)H nitroreductase [Halalkalibacter okhensis]
MSINVSEQEKKALYHLMEERHSVKQYQPDYKISRAELEEMLQAATTAPSAWNLQHWRFLVIEDQKKKEELLPIAYYQQQIVDASFVIAVLGDVEANKEAEGIYQEAVEEGFMSEEIKDTLVGQINGAYERGGSFARDAAFLNASLAAMQFMLAAKAMDYDTCPIGGFKREEFIDQFHVPDRFTPIMLMTVGKAAKEAYPSSRKALENVVTYNSF